MKFTFNDLDKFAIEDSEKKYKYLQSLIQIRPNICIKDRYNLEFSVTTLRLKSKIKRETLYQRT